MDGQRFDALTRVVAAATSRRALVKLMLGGAGSAILAGLGLGRFASAQECRGSGRLCGDHEQCCSGRCDPDTERCACADDERYCGDRCVTPSSDLDHCGACDVACDEGEACCDGRCVPACRIGRTLDRETCRCVCAEGRAVCGPTCCETDQSCTADRCCTNAGGICGAEQRCCAGLTCCDGRCVDLTTDPLHCGACGGACDSDRYLCEEATCTDAVCGVQPLPDGAECLLYDRSFGCCGGICADLYEEPHCGACGVSCGPAETCCRGEGCYDLTDAWS